MNSSIEKFLIARDQQLLLDVNGNPRSAIDQLVVPGYQPIPRGQEGEQLHLEPVFIQATTLNDAWFRTNRTIMERGRNYEIAPNGSFEGQFRRQLDHVTLQILSPGNRSAFIPFLPEAIPAITSMDYIRDYLRNLTTAERAENETYTYGQYLEPQIFDVIKKYKADGHNSNQMTMTVGDMDSIDLKDPPCLRLIDTKIIYGKLHFYVTFRSWDAWAGLPTNLGGIQLLKEFMADEIGVEDGDLVATSAGLHIYSHFWETASVVTGIAA